MGLVLCLLPGDIQAGFGTMEGIERAIDIDIGIAA